MTAQTTEQTTYTVVARDADKDQEVELPGLSLEQANSVVMTFAEYRKAGFRVSAVVHEE